MKVRKEFLMLLLMTLVLCLGSLVLMSSGGPLVEKSVKPRRQAFLQWRKEHEGSLIPSLPARAPSACSLKSVHVTGLPRSGTTIMGYMTAFLEEVRMVHEPGNPSNRNGALCPAFRPNQHGFPFQQQFTDIEAADSQMQRASESFFDAVFDRCCRDVQAIVIKDPTITNSAEWLQKRYGNRVIMMIRHPAAIINSWQSLGWGSRGLDTLTDRYNRWMADYVVRFYKNHWADEDWLFLLHEDFCRDPLGVAELVTDFVSGSKAWRQQEGLVGKLVQYVAEYTNKGNKEKAHQYHMVSLDASAQMTNWQAELDLDTIEKIKRDTEVTWRLFYDDSDWVMV